MADNPPGAAVVLGDATWRRSKQVIGSVQRGRSGIGESVIDTGAECRLEPGGVVSDAVLTDAGIEVVLSGVRVLQMNSIMERQIQAATNCSIGPNREPCPSALLGTVKTQQGARRCTARIPTCRRS